METKCEWFDNLTQSIKKRMGDITKTNKETLAQLKMAGVPIIDTEEIDRKEK